MTNYYYQIIDEYFSLSPNIICWDRITSVSIFQPFSSIHLRVLFSRTTHLRILTLTYQSEWHHPELFNDKTLIDLINDESLCNKLMSNGLRQLNLFFPSGQSNLINLSHLIVERLPDLEVIGMTGGPQQIELIEMTSILIHGLFKLSFVTLSGFCEICLIYEREILLCNSNTRSIRMEMSTISLNGKTLLIWL